MRMLKSVAWSLTTLVAIAALASFAASNDDGVPVGTIMAWAGEKDSVPTNWMICDGKVLKINQYKDLYNAIGWSWGKPNNKKFNLPDLRGRFMRGVDDGSGFDPDAEDREQANKGGNSEGVGSVQDDAVQEHSHYQLAHYHRDRYPGSYVFGTLNSGGTAFLYNSASYRDTDSVQPTISGVIKYKNHAKTNTAEETRPKNAGVYFIIKVK